MRAYIGFDDTDALGSDYGTGKLARWFENVLPEECKLWGVVRQQLLVDSRIPYTSHNSSACVIVDFSNPSLKDKLLSLAIAHIKDKSHHKSDPGICFACDGDQALPELISFGKLCTAAVVTQKDAFHAAKGVHLSGHGGTNDGIIGAVAAVGLTASGWSGRFIEFGRLRNFNENVSVSDLEKSGIHVISVDRNAVVPAPDDIVNTKKWLRPRLLGYKAVLPVLPGGQNLWYSIGDKSKTAL